MLPRVAATALLAVVLLGGQRPAAQDDPRRTRAELTAYQETSTNADVERIVSAIGDSPLVHTEVFGRSEEGRPLPLLVISDPSVTTPASARRLGRPIVLVQASIHAGEVEGKEASLILARRLADGDLRGIAKQLVILIAPLYNADGNERIDVEHRPDQNGPAGGVGTRENARGLDLNRDYMKLDSVEARALVDLLDTWDPHVVVDLHTTNGSYHGYHLTFAPALNPNADERLTAFTRETMLAGVRTALLDRHGFRSYYYGNFASEQDGRERRRIDPSQPGDTIWRTFDHRPRFGNNYVGLRNRIAILSEAYSYLDFQGRVSVTSAFVEEIWRSVARHATRILNLTAQADRTLTVRTRLSKPLDLGLDFTLRAAAEPVTILVGDVTARLQPGSEVEVRAMAETITPLPMREYGSFAVTRARALPAGWVIPRGLAANPRMTAALERLRWHGIETEVVESATQMDVERFVIQTLTRSETTFQGHQEARLSVSMERAALSVDPGSIVIRANQRLGRLAFYLLEPDSDDGLVTWNVIDDGLSIGQGFPVYRIR